MDLVRCALFGKQLAAAEAKGGRRSRYVYSSLFKCGSSSCRPPRFKAKRFDSLIFDQLRDHVLAESNVRKLVKLSGEELDGAAREEHIRLELIEAKSRVIRRMLGRIW